MVGRHGAMKPAGRACESGGIGRLYRKQPAGAQTPCPFRGAKQREGAMPDNDTERLGRIASVFFNVGTIVHAELGREAKLEAHAEADGTVVTVLMDL